MTGDLLDGAGGDLDEDIGDHAQPDRVGVDDRAHADDTVALQALQPVAYGTL